jgi:ubiquinone biosynthesis protein
VEGLGRDLYPDLDVWNTATPILREWMRERSGARALLRTLRTEAPQLLAGMRELPAALQRLLRAPLVPAAAPTSQELDALRAEMRSARRRQQALALGTLLLAGFAALALTRGLGWPAWTLLAAGAVTVLCALWR